MSFNGSGRVVRSLGQRIPGGIVMGKRGVRLSDLSPEARKQAKAYLKTMPAPSKLATVLATNCQERRHKFNVSAPEKRTFNGIVFDSIWEMRVYKWLIFGPQKYLWTVDRQTRFLLQASKPGVRAIWYESDFVLRKTTGSFNEVTSIKELGDAIVIDAKGMQTPAFRLKHKLFIERYRRELFLPKTIRDLENLDWSAPLIAADQTYPYDRLRYQS